MKCRTTGGEKRDVVAGMAKVCLMGKMMEIVPSPRWRGFNALTLITLQI